MFGVGSCVSMAANTLLCNRCKAIFSFQNLGEMMERDSVRGYPTDIVPQGQHPCELCKILRDYAQNFSEASLWTFDVGWTPYGNVSHPRVQWERASVKQYGRIHLTELYAELDDTRRVEFQILSGTGKFMTSFRQPLGYSAI